MVLGARKVRIAVLGWEPACSLEYTSMAGTPLLPWQNKVLKSPQGPLQGPQQPVNDKPGALKIVVRPGRQPHAQARKADVLHAEKVQDRGRDPPVCLSYTCISTLCFQYKKAWQPDRLVAYLALRKLAMLTHQGHLRHSFMPDWCWSQMNSNHVLLSQMSFDRAMNLTAAQTDINSTHKDIPKKVMSNA